MAAGRKTGGRQKGTPNKATSDIKALAQKHAPDAIACLHQLMKDDKTPPQAKISAARELLDRGYGKPSQTINKEGEGDKTVVVIHGGLPADAGD